MNLPYQHTFRKNVGYVGLGFTLIELLVVIAIISLLVSILIPSLTKAKDLARRTICQTQFRSLHTAFIFYADDHRGLVIDSPRYSSNLSYYDNNWPSYLATYCDMQKRNYSTNLSGDSWAKTSKRNIFICPSEQEPDKYYSYSLNFDLIGGPQRVKNGEAYAHRLGDEDDNGAKCMRMGDTGDIWYINSGICNYADLTSAERMLAKRHMSGGNYLFCDGHVEWLPAELYTWRWSNSDYNVRLWIN